MGKRALWISLISLFLVIPAITAQGKSDNPLIYDPQVIPFVSDYDAKGNGFLMNFYITNISQDEYDYIVTKTLASFTDKLISKDLKDSSASLVFRADNLGDVDKIHEALNSLQVTYDAAQGPTNLLTEVSSFRQYVFSKLTSARSSGKYTVQVQFDPNSEVNIGGYIMQTDREGKAIFNGTNLNLSEAKNGVIKIVDSMGNQIKVNKNSDNAWFVSISGLSLGKTAEKNIIIEAIK